MSHESDRGALARAMARCHERDHDGEHEDDLSKIVDPLSMIDRANS